MSNNKSKLSNWLIKHPRLNPLRFSWNGSYRTLTASSRTFPDFMVIGFPKCGTKSLFSYVTQHPNIGIPTDYGKYFFDANFKRGINWYKAHYPTVKEKRKLKESNGAYVFGDYSARYMMYYPSALRIKKIVPKTKLIVVLRNPVERAYSQFNFKEMGRYRNEEKDLSLFSDAIQEDEKRLKDWEYMVENNLITRENHVSIHTPYLTMGKYAVHLKEWFKIFPKEQFHFVSTDNMSSELEIQKTVSDVFKFLEVSDYKISDFSRKNVGSYEKIDPEERKVLSDYYRPFNEKLEELLNMKFNWS